MTRRAGAAFAGATLILGGAGLTALAPAAQAGVTTPTVHCVLPAGQGEGTGPQEMDVTLSPANAAPGSVVHAVVTLGAGPVNSTQTLNNVQTTPSIDLAMSGGATGTVTVTGPTFEIDTVNGQPVIIPTYEGDFIIPNNAQGVVDFTPVGTNTRTVVFGLTFNTPCTVQSGATSIGSINVQGPGSEQPTLISPSGTVRTGDTLSFDGLGWPEGETPSVELCPADGSACVLDGFTSSNLTISALGELSGTATLSGVVADGDYLVRVTAGAKQADSPVTVERYVPTEPRTLLATPPSGPVGTVVTLTGANFNPNTQVVALPTDDSGISLGVGLMSFVTGADGTFSVSYTIPDPETTQIRVREGASSARQAFAPFTVTDEPPAVVSTPDHAFRDQAVSLSGGYWPAGVSVGAQLCDASGNNCSASGLSAQSLSVSATGDLSGSVTIASGVGFGNHTIEVATSSGQRALAPVVVQRTLKITKQAGHLYKIEGWDFGDFETVYVKGLNADGNQKNSISTFTLASGYWLTYLVLDSDVVSIYAEDTSSTPKTSTVRFR